MAFTELSFYNYRNLVDASLHVDPKLNLIVGENGSGKTNLLEAIYYLGHGRSFKRTPANKIIKQTFEQFILYSKLANQQADTIGIEVNKTGTSRLRINGKDGNRLADLVKLLPVQIISPESLNFFTAGPSQRRIFLDWGLFYHYSDFHQIWLTWQRLLRQRNTLLHQVASDIELDIWEQQLAEYVEQITSLRQQYSAGLIPYIQHNIQLFLDDNSIDISYTRGWDRQTDYLIALQKNRKNDRALGYTALGPQKSDFKLRIDNVPIEYILSRGQLKLIIIALKLAQYEYLVATYPTKKTVMLIDDFASELDRNKQQQLATKLQNSQAQVFISNIHAQQVTELFSEQASIFHLQEGTIIQDKFLHT